MAYFIADYETLDKDGVVIATQTLCLVYPTTTSCQDEEAAVNASEAATLAARTSCTAMPPAVPTGQMVIERSCGGFDVIVTADNLDAPGTSTNGGSTGGTAGDDPAATQDLSGETNVKFYKPGQTIQ